MLDKVSAVVSGLFVFVAAVVVIPTILAFVVAAAAGGPVCESEGPRGPIPKVVVNTYEFYREWLAEDGMEFRDCK